MAAEDVGEHDDQQPDPDEEQGEVEHRQENFAERLPSISHISMVLRSTLVPRRCRRIRIWGVPVAYWSWRQRAAPAGGWAPPEQGGLSGWPRWGSGASGAGCHAPSDRCGFLARADSELSVDHAEVELQRVDRDEQLSGDLSEGEPARQHPQHLELAVCEVLPGQAGVGGRRPAGGARPLCGVGRASPCARARRFPREARGPRLPPTPPSAGAPRSVAHPTALATCSCASGSDSAARASSRSRTTACRARRGETSPNTTAASAASPWKSRTLATLTPPRTSRRPARTRRGQPRARPGERQQRSRSRQPAEPACAGELTAHELLGTLERQACRVDVPFVEPELGQLQQRQRNNRGHRADR